MSDHSITVIKSSDTSEDFYQRCLSSFKNKRIYAGAVDAIQGLEKTPVDVVIAELNLEDMSGIEIAETIREIDADRNHYTYIILISKSACEETQDALSSTVDCYVDMSDTNLIRSSAQAGSRIAHHINELATENRLLDKRCQDLQKGQLLDPLTGLGNRQYAELSLNDAIRHIESRGGAICFMMISVSNYSAVLEKYDQRIADELMIEVAKRMNNIVRPMDIVTYFGEGKFALILVQQTLDQCTAECYQHIFDGISLKSFQTAIGFVDAQIAMSICASMADTGAPNSELVIKSATSNLKSAQQTKRIAVAHLAAG